MAIEIRGLEGVLSTFDKISAGEGIKQGLEQSCMLVERTAKQKAPKVDGNLRRSITSKVEGMEGVVYTPLFYAPYVEYGTGLFATGTGGGRKDVPWVYYDEKHNQFVRTSGQTPQPYMRPALDENRDKIIDLIREGITSRN